MPLICSHLCEWISYSAGNIRVKGQSIVYGVSVCLCAPAKRFTFGVRKIETLTSGCRSINRLIGIDLIILGIIKNKRETATPRSHWSAAAISQLQQHFFEGLGLGRRPPRGGGERRRRMRFMVKQTGWWEVNKVFVFSHKWNEIFFFFYPSTTTTRTPLNFLSTLKAPGAKSSFSWDEINFARVESDVEVMFKLRFTFRISKLNFPTGVPVINYECAFSQFIFNITISSFNQGL